MKNIVIQGIPYDDKSSFLEGAAEAPEIIREVYHSDASNKFAENGIDTDSDLVADLGDFEINEYFEIEQLTRKSLEKGRVIALGGDHSITYPVVKAIHSVHDQIDILHFDAHTDLYEDYDGDRFSHACPFARIMEGGHASRLVQVGIRTLNDHQREQAERFGVEIIEASGFDAAQIPDFKNPVYVSVDMDVFDPAFAPGVSHQEPGGLTSREVIDSIKGIESEIVGADIVEFNPTRDVTEITGALAAKLLKEILGKMLEERD
ncbi:MAG: agmatinase [Pyrinomonadaceae bacterium]|nr:agmatinase [Pyrinomonadaceae bacterium]